MEEAKDLRTNANNYFAQPAHAEELMDVLLTSHSWLAELVTRLENPLVYTPFLAALLTDTVKVGFYLGRIYPALPSREGEPPPVLPSNPKEKIWRDFVDGLPVEEEPGITV